ncbi:hypothetical protein GEMRC1_010653 [Eukaryota sp. GEM-RC1]
MLEYSACDKVGADGARLTLRDCVEEDLLESISFVNPDVTKSDEELRKFLESSCEYASIEEVYEAFLQLKMDSTITNPRARVLDYTRQVVAVKRRAKKYELPEKAVLSRFVKGVLPKGLSESLKTRVADGYFSSLSELVEVTIEDLTDFERVNQWKSRSRLSSSSEMVDTPDVKKVRHGEALSKSCALNAENRDISPLCVRQSSTLIVSICCDTPTLLST